MICRNCGAELEPDTRFCGQCGTKVIETENRNDFQQENERMDNRPQKAGNTQLLIVVLVIVILASAIVLGVTALTKSPFGGFSFGGFGRQPKQEQVNDFGDKKKEYDDQDYEEDEFDEYDAYDYGDEPYEEEEYDDFEDWYSYDYFFPSDRYYITRSDLQGKTKSEVAFIRNEIYARHGYIFQTEPYKSYFSRMEWYEPNPNFSENLFNSVEKANKSFVVEYEKSMGWR